MKTSLPLFCDCQAFPSSTGRMTNIVPEKKLVSDYWLNICDFPGLINAYSFRLYLAKFLGVNFTFLTIDLISKL